jgi:hypothetical protein
MDLDGNLEIIIEFDQGNGVLQNYILREIGDTLQRIGKLEGEGYGIYDIMLVKMRGSSIKYIKTTVSNGEGLFGFGLYQVKKDDIDMIQYSASSTGSGNDSLTSTTKDDIYDGYVQSRYSYDVMNFRVDRFYKWDGESFSFVSVSVDAGEYPAKPKEVVNQLLKLNMLWDDDRNSNDVIKRMSEINLSKKQLNIDKINQVIENDSQENYWIAELQTDNLKMITQEDAQSAIVTVPVQNNKLKFTLFKDNNVWHISNIEGDFVINKGM